MGDAIVAKEVSMEGSDGRDGARRRRQRLIERLNEKESELSGAQSARSRLSAEELEAEIEKERQRNFLRAGFSQIFGA